MQNLSCQFKACKIPDDGPLGHSVMINPCFAVIIRLRSAIAGTISHFHLAYILGSLRQFNVYQKQVCSSSCSGAFWCNNWRRDFDDATEEKHRTNLTK